MHISIPLDSNPNVEFINVDMINPLISHCVIKVCYAGQNRNKTIISESLLRDLGKTLPGSPIVGYYVEAKEDFNEHDRTFEVDENGFYFRELTRPYGFVDLNAKVWLQDFLDDDGIVRKYLCTEGYIWTGAYPESQRIIEKGNNQSMELNEKTLKGNWTKDEKTQEKFFIINEALIEKLCILGEDIEPCFEGAQIKSSFSLDKINFEDFKNTMYSMINELKDTLNKGGTLNQMQEDLQTTENAVDRKVYNKLTVSENLFNINEEQTTATNVSVETPVIDETSTDFKKDKENEEEVKENTEEAKDNSSEKTEDKDKKDKKKYNLDEIQEYVDLKKDFDELSATFAALKEQTDSLQAEFQKLKDFKEQADLKEKQNMIDSFCMLDEQDKEDVQKNINSYSLDEIESKLAVICVRKKVNFNLNEEETEPNRTFNLAEVEESFSGSEWMRAVEETASKME